MTQTPTARTMTASFFDTYTNLWSDAFLAERGVIFTMMTMASTTTKTMGDFDDDDHGNNDHKDDDNNNARTTSTSFMTQQQTWGWMYSWKGGGVICDFNNKDKDDNNDNARASVSRCHRLDDMRHVDEGDVGWVCR